jgi:hypothetical protein
VTRGVGTEACPRCGQAFRCGIDDQAPCPCTGVRLSVAQLSAIRASFDDCLCVDCLSSIARGEAPAGQDI